MRLRYINSVGKELILDAWPDRRHFILQSWEGFGEVPVTLQTRKSPYQDGVSLVGQLLEPRHLSLEIVIYGTDKQEVYDRRRFIQNLFNPKLGVGRLDWTQPDGKTYSIGVIPDGSPAFPAGDARSRVHQVAMVDLIAPDPAWTDTTDTNILIASAIGRFRFPLTLPTEMGVLDNEHIVINDGDMPAPVVITFNGPLVNPMIQNKTTGEFVRVKQTLKDNEKLLIDTSFGSKRVVFIDSEGNQKNAFGSIDLESQFWWLNVGENHLIYSTDSGIGTVMLRYKQRYVGV